MADVQLPKKRKIQPIFLGALSGPAATSTINGQSTVATADANKETVNGTNHIGASSSFSIAQQQNQEPGCLATSTCPLRVNSRLIGRLDDAPNSRQNHESPSKSEPTDGDVDREATPLNNSALSMRNCSFEGTPSGTNNNQVDVQQQQPLPELRLDSSVKLRPLPQVTDIRNATKVGLPAPQAQQELELSLQLGPESRIDRVLVQNSLLNKRTLKSSYLQAKLGREAKWSHMLPSPVLLLRANQHWTVSSHEDKSLYAFHTQSGRISFSLQIQNLVAVLELRDDHCLALSTDAEAQVWDLRHSKSVLRTSIRTLLLDYSTGTHQIVRAYVSATGVPVLILSSGDAFFYAKSLQSWLHLRIGQDFLLSRISSMQSIAKALPDGLMAVLSEAAKRIEKSNFIVAPQRLEMAAANEERQLEQLLRVVRELGSWEEHRLFTTVYAQMLLSREKHAKFVEFLEEIKALSESKQLPFSFATVLADLRPLAARKGLDLEAMLKGKKKTEYSGETDINILLKRPDQ